MSGAAYEEREVNTMKVRSFELLTSKGIRRSFVSNRSMPATWSSTSSAIPAGARGPVDLCMRWQVVQRTPPRAYRELCPTQAFSAGGQAHGDHSGVAQTPAGPIRGKRS